MDPCAAIHSVIKVTRERAAKRSIKLEVDCEKGLDLQADPVLFQRLAMNLINNAIDASFEHSAVRISLAKFRSDLISLRVADRGVGIVAEDLNRVFDPYFTTKNTGDSGRGLGLGLAICRKIVDLHGGNIEVASTPGGGTAFTASFPRVAQMPYLRETTSDINHEPGPLARSRPVASIA